MSASVTCERGRGGVSRAAAATRVEGREEGGRGRGLRRQAHAYRQGAHKEADSSCQYRHHHGHDDGAQGAFRQA